MEIMKTIITILLHGEEVGRLDMKDGKMIFIGNVDQSAQIFFDEVVKIAMNNQIEDNNTGWLKPVE
jgi:hypothetical protein